MWTVSGSEGGNEDEMRGRGERVRGQGLRGERVSYSIRWMVIWGEGTPTRRRCWHDGDNDRQQKCA